MRGVLPFCGHHPTTTTRERCRHQQWTPTHTPHLAGCVDVDAWARKQVVHNGHGARAHCRSQRRVSNLGTHTGVHRGSLGKCIAHRLSPHASGRHELIRRPASQGAINRRTSMCPSMAASTSVLDRLRFAEADPASASAVPGVACVAHAMGDTTTRERHCQHRPMGSPCTHRQQFHRLGVLARFCHVQRRLASLERLTPHTHTHARAQHS